MSVVCLMDWIHLHWRLINTLLYILRGGDTLRLYVLLLILMMVARGVVWAQETINPNEPIEGTLSENQLTAEYTFTGEAGSTVTITLSSRMFDAYLTLQDANGGEIGSNDDAGGSLDSHLELTL